MEIAILAATLLATVVIGAVGLYLQHLNNRHFARQNEIMIADAKGAPMPEKTTIKPPRWPLVVMLSSVCLIWAAVSYDIYDRHQLQASTPLIVKDGTLHFAQPELKEDGGKRFAGETVQIDGIEYTDSTLDDVSIEYNGTAPARIVRPSFVAHEGKCTVHLNSSNPIVLTTMELVAATMQACRAALSGK
jgi:hypothetical protein